MYFIVSLKFALRINSGMGNKLINTVPYNNNIRIVEDCLNGKAHLDYCK